jgi:hypothetical protein
MKHIELQPKELPNFILLARAAKQKYHYTVVAGMILLSASESFLTSIGY